MIVVYAGRRSESLPSNHCVSERLQRLLVGLAPTTLVGAAADGGDLLVLEAAMSQGCPPLVHLVLPTEADVFAEASVDDGWRARFERVLRRVRDGGGTIESLGLPDGEEAYRAANARMLEVAKDMQDGTDERAVALVVASPGEGAMISDLTDAAALMAVPVLRIDPAVDLEQQPSCFVAMPFGTKYDVQRKTELDCDLVYRRIIAPALENAQVRYRRADEEIDSGVVLVPMMEWLADADLVIGDLTTANFNVGWELGLRHLLRDRDTILMLPDGAQPPFDLSILRHVNYELEDSGLTDQAIVSAWEAIHPYLAALDTTTTTDSPIAAVMKVQRWAQISAPDDHDSRFEALRETLALARDMRDPRMMRETAEQATRLGARATEILQAEAGVGLVRLKCFTEAVGLLEPLVAKDPSALRPEAHLYLAQARYRRDDATIEDLDTAETILRALEVQRPGHPEVRALMGAVTKRRSVQRRDPDRQAEDLRLMLDHYAWEYERDLDSFYQGINVVACGVALELGHDDRPSGERARRLLDAVRTASLLRLEREPSNFWAAVTLAETYLHACLLRRTTARKRPLTAYGEAGALRPDPAALNSSLYQFEWLQKVGVTDPLVAEARDALTAATGG